MILIKAHIILKDFYFCFFDDKLKNFRPKDVDDDGDDDEEGGEGGVEADHDGLAAYLLVAHPGLPHLPPGLPSQFLNRHWLLEHN